MKLIRVTIDKKRNWSRREIRLKETPLKKSSALQISKLTLDRKEPYHTNKVGYTLCFVVEGWMESYCSGRNYRLKEGRGIIFEPGERHRINKGEGWMISISSLDYEDLDTNWES